MQSHHDLQPLENKVGLNPCHPSLVPNESVAFLDRETFAMNMNIAMNRHYDNYFDVDNGRSEIGT